MKTFLKGMHVQGYSFRPPKKYKPTQQSFWCTRNLNGIVCYNVCSDYSELVKILPRAVKGEYFSEGTEKCKNLANLKERQLESLKEHYCPNVQDLAVTEEAIWICLS